MNQIKGDSDLDSILLEQLKDKLEGICIKPGYIKPGSIVVLSRTNGIMNVGEFNGNIRFIMKYTAEVCNPSINEVIECTVGDINKAAINAYVGDDEAKTPLNIFMARQHHIGNTEFFALNRGDRVKMKILGKTYNYRDSNILVFGQFDGKID